MRWNSDERYGLTPDQTIDFYKKSIGQISRKTDVNVWDIFEKAYRQCIAEGLKFRRLNDEVVNKWSYWNSEEGRAHFQSLYKKRKSDGWNESYSHYFSRTVEHPCLLIKKDDSGYSRFWTLSYFFVIEQVCPERCDFEKSVIQNQEAKEEEKKSETVIDTKTCTENTEFIKETIKKRYNEKLQKFIDQIKDGCSTEQIERLKRYSSWGDWNFRNKFYDLAKSDWEKQGHREFNTRCPSHTYLNYKSFWDFALELIKGYDFEATFEDPRIYEAERLAQIELAEKQRKEHLKEYQKDYFQKNKQAVYAKRKEKGYNENIKSQWADASFKYKNKVCIYEGQYFYFEQLKRKLKSSEKTRTFLLPEADQTRMCLYKGQEYEFWMLCYQLRKLKDNPYEVALNSVVKKPNL